MKAYTSVKRVTVLFALLVFLLAGCAHMSPTEQSTLSGGAIGAGAGAAVGAISGGSPGIGAAVGGAAGALGGYLLNQYNRDHYRY